MFPERYEMFAKNNRRGTEWLAKLLVSAVEDKL